MCAALLTGGCGTDDAVTGPVDHRPLRIAEENGKVREVGLRDTYARVVRKLGPPDKARPDESIPPDPAPGADFVPGTGTARYPGVVFTFYETRVTDRPRRRARVAAFVAYGKRARTERGVRISDPLSKARRRYRLRCADEPDPSGGDREVSPAQCTGKLGPGTYIVFAASLGSERIGSITLAAEPNPNGCAAGGFRPRHLVRRCMREAKTGRPAK